MNIEDILPELFGEKRVYYCQRCLNHGLHEKRKNHKQYCLFRNCQCSDCMMVDRRRELNSRLLQIDTPTENCSSSEGPASASDAITKTKERRPNCQRCAQHNVVNRLKGHKRACPFKECFCPKCQVVVERQKLMADQIKLRRRQKREKNQMLEARESSPAAPDTTTWSTNSDELMCMKCAQQAFGYQQLMSVLDPTTATDPLATLAAILHACPHRQ